MIALLSAVAFAAAPGTLGGALEYDVVGANPALGPRFEATYRLSPELGGQRLLGAVALVVTPEYTYLPFTLGWRSTGKIDKAVAPVVGAGMQAQFFLLSDMPVQARHAWMAEFGARYSASELVDLTLVVSPELITFGVPGIGLAVRLGASFGREG